MDVCSGRRPLGFIEALELPRAWAWIRPRGKEGGMTPLSVQEQEVLVAEEVRAVVMTAMPETPWLVGVIRMTLVERDAVRFLSRMAVMMLPAACRSRKPLQRPETSDDWPQANRIYTTDLTLIRPLKKRPNPGKMPSFSQVGRTICRTCRVTMPRSAGIYRPNDRPKRHENGPQPTHSPCAQATAPRIVLRGKGR